MNSTQGGERVFLDVCQSCLLLVNEYSECGIVKF